MSNKVRIPAAVWEGLDAVRQSGLTNMLDRPRVIEIAELWGYDETAEWLRANSKAYSEGIFAGFAPVEEGGEQCVD
jgi:hypothetical protein